MIQEKVTYTPWFPFEETKESFDIIDFSHNFKTLIINLLKRKSEKKTDLRVTFSARMEICRVMNETYRNKLNSHFKEIFEHVSINGPLYIVENSDYMKSLSEESSTLTDILGFKHYFIADSEWTFDVACQDQPKIELFIENELIKSV